MNFIIGFIIIHGNTIHNAVVDGIFLFCKNVFYLLVQQNDLACISPAFP